LSQTASTTRRYAELRDAVSLNRALPLGGFGRAVLDARCVRDFSIKCGTKRREQKEEDKFMRDQKKPEVPEEATVLRDAV
jgi:hypothetical protein